MRISLILLASLLFATTAFAWVARDVPPAGYRFGLGVAVGQDGNPVSAGFWSHQLSGAPTFLVRKYAADDGTELWSYDLIPPAGAQAVANEVAVDANGDVFAAGIVSVPGDDSVVVKLSGLDGSEIWRRDIGGVDYQQIADMAATADGDVVVALREGELGSQAAIVRRLDGTTGADEWAVTVAGSDGMFAIAIDAAGDVVCGGRDDPTSSNILVVKLDGTDGSELWRETAPGYGWLIAIEIDALGDVVGAGTRSDDPDPFSAWHPVVVKLAGPTGALLWEQDLATAEPEQYVAIALDAAGNAYATGHDDGQVLAAKLDAATGAVVWRRGIAGDDPFGNAVGVSSSGVPVFGGQLDHRFTLLSLTPDTGDLLWIEQLPGTSAGVGRVTDLTLADGWIYAAGTSFLQPSGDDPRLALTTVRLVDPSAPPIVGACTPAPRGDCRGPIEPLRSQVLLKDAPGTRSDKLQWKLTRGEATTTAELGDPAGAGGDYTLCLYDASATRIFSVVVPAGGTCAGKPCWKATGTKGFAYRSARPREPEGLDRLKLGAGEAGKTKVAVTRRGRPNVDLPIPPVAGLTLPLTVQLQQDGGNCFGATFGSSGVVKNDGVTFKARGD